MSLLRPLIAAGLAVGALTATASAAPLPLARDHQPPRYIDESDFRIVLFDHSEDSVSGYGWIVFARVLNVGSKTDAIEIEWTQKGKVLSTQRCKFGGIDEGTGEFECRYEGKPLKAAGDVVANIKYWDDQTESFSLLRQLKLDVGTYYWNESKHWQISGDDLLGSAYVWHQKQGDGTIVFHNIHFYFWVARSIGGEETALRCSVNGKRIDDFEVQLDRVGSIDREDTSTGQRLNYVWNNVDMRVSGMYYGTREELTKFPGKSLPSDARVLGELPGDWSCDLRADGKAVRTFKFKVNEKGHIAPHASAGAKNATVNLDSVEVVDVILPKKNEFDVRVDPKAIKAGHRFGLPWPEGLAPKELPPASGHPEPGKGKKAGKKNALN